MYCIDRARVPESHDARAFYYTPRQRRSGVIVCGFFCLYDKHGNPGENRINSKAVQAASVKHKY